MDSDQDVPDQELREESLNQEGYARMDQHNDPHVPDPELHCRLEQRQGGLRSGPSD